MEVDQKIKALVVGFSIIVGVSLLVTAIGISFIVWRFRNG